MTVNAVPSEMNFNKDQLKRILAYWLEKECSKPGLEFEVHDVVTSSSPSSPACIVKLDAPKTKEEPSADSTAQ